MRFLLQSITISASFLSVFAWQNSPLSEYTIQTLGVLIFLYMITSARKRFNPLSEGGSNLWTIYTLNTLIFLLIFSTGMLNSPLFFLLYFLGFGIAFIFEPGTVFIFFIGTILILFQQIISDDIITNVIRVGSLGLISPLAFFFGREFKDRETEEKKTEAIRESVSEKVESVIENESQTLSKDDLARLTEVLNETRKL